MSTVHEEPRSGSWVVYPLMPALAETKASPEGDRVYRVRPTGEWTEEQEQTMGRVRLHVPGFFPEGSDYALVFDSEGNPMRVKIGKES